MNRFLLSLLAAAATAVGVTTSACEPAAPAAPRAESSELATASTISVRTEGNQVVYIIDAQTGAKGQFTFDESRITDSTVNAVMPFGQWRHRDGVVKVTVTNNPTPHARCDESPEETIRRLDKQRENTIPRDWAPSRTKRVNPICEADGTIYEHTIHIVEGAAQREMEDDRDDHRRRRRDEALLEELG